MSDTCDDETMSREVRRVPLSFTWPLHKTWQGYLMPAELRLPACPDCELGETPARAWLRTLMHRLEMLADDGYAQEQGRPLHPWLAEDRYPPTRAVRKPVSDTDRETARKVVAAYEARGAAAPCGVELDAADGSTELVGYDVLRPSPDILDLVAGLSGTARERLDRFHLNGSDYRMTKAVITAAGLDERWGICATCNGTAEVGTDEQRAAAEAWQPTEPPEGDGWQLWETVSEGSPSSPVFPDRARLVTWLTTDYQQVGAGPLTREQAEEFITAGHSLGTFVISNGQMASGEAAVADAVASR